MPNAKRILTVTIKRISDNSPDTSHLGKYGSRAESVYAIDREHSIECQLNNHANDSRIDNLERIIRYLDTQRIEEGARPDCSTRPWYSGLEDAQASLLEIQEDLAKCDCGGQILGRNEYRYFNPNLEDYKRLPDADIRKYCAQDYERMESLNNGDWYYIGIGASAEIQTGAVRGVTGMGQRLYTTQTITSGGLWGIESDSDDAYLASVEEEELSELRAELYALGFGKRAVATAVKNLTRKDG